MRWAIVMLIVGAARAATADPKATSKTTAPVSSAAPASPAASQAAPLATTLVPEDAPRACHQPACDAARAQSGEQMVPVDVKIPIGGVAIASMEGLWLRRGPTLRDKPIMLSPIVVGGALTLSLGGSF